MSLKVIDTHIHIWNLEKVEYEWLRGDTSILNRSYNLMEINNERLKVGIEEGVLVQAANNFEDTELMLQAAEQSGWISGVVGWVPLANTHATEKALHGIYSKNKLLKGVRHLIHNEEDPQWLLKDQVIESLKLLAQSGLTYDVVGVLPVHIQTALKVAEKVPELKMVFDHMNQPPIAPQERFGTWGDLIREASAHQNFYIKISGLGTASRNFENWSAGDIMPYVEFAFKHFGEDRCICGGDWPVSLLAGSYKKTWNTYREVISSLLDREGQEKVFNKNAKAFYHL